MRVADLEAGSRVLCVGDAAGLWEAGCCVWVTLLGWQENGCRVLYIVLSRALCCQVCAYCWLRPESSGLQSIC